MATSDRRIVLPSLGVLGLVAAAFACSSFGTSGAAPPADDGGAASDANDNPLDQDAGNEAGADAGGPDAGADPGNLLENAGFELGCAGWTVHHGTLVPDPTARTGTIACRLCPSGSVAVGLTQRIWTPLDVGASYRLEAWVRTAPAQDVPSGMFVHMSPLSGQGQKSGTTTSSEPAPTAMWSLIGTSVTIVNDTYARLEIEIAAQSAPGCFLIDDVSLRKK